MSQKEQNVIIMIQLRLSGIITDMAGKLGGSTAYHGRTGLTLKNNHRGKNPSTAAQVGVRSSFKDASAGWKILTDPQMAAFISAAKARKRTNKVGLSFTGSGAAYYSAVNDTASWFNSAAINSSLPAPITLPITTPPSGLDAQYNGNIDTLVLKNVAGTQTFTLDIPLISAGDCAVLEATPNLSNGVSNPKGKFRPIKYFAAAAAQSAADVLAAYQAEFGDLIVNKKVFVRLRLYKLAGNNVLKQYSGTELSGQVKAI
jgi:hypothetical protein